MVQLADRGAWLRSRCVNTACHPACTTGCVVHPPFGFRVLGEGGRSLAADVPRPDITSCTTPTIRYNKGSANAYTMFEFCLRCKTGYTFIQNKAIGACVCMCVRACLEWLAWITCEGRNVWTCVVCACALTPLRVYPENRLPSRRQARVL